MPGFDGTGPWGAGPMTGRGRGLCGPSGYGFGRGRGMGRGFRTWSGPGFGRGRGFGRGFGRRAFYPAWSGGYAPATGYPYGMAPVDETDALKQEAEAMRTDLAEIEKRIRELEEQSE